MSSHGDDGNPCTAAYACRSFSGALAITAEGGEINCVDTGQYGTVKITVSVSIVCDGAVAGVSPSSGVSGIVIDGPGITVLLSGLELNGFGEGQNGVEIIEAANVVIRRTSIRNFTNSGIDMQAQPGSMLHLIDSDVIGNAALGLFIKGQSGGPNIARIENTFFALNGGASVTVSGPSMAFLAGSTLGDDTSLDLLGGGIAFSFGTNQIFGKGKPTGLVPRE